MGRPHRRAGPAVTGAAPPIRLEMCSDTKYLSCVRELVAETARRLGFDHSTTCQIALAVDEALANVIRHGYGCRKDGRIWLSLWPERGDGGQPGIRVIIEDEARQVGVDQIRGRSLDDVKPGGLGVHIIREIMDEVIYEPRESEGMRLTMIKRGPALAPRGSQGECDA